MWYVSFQGETGTVVPNILVYHNNGKPHTQPNLLPTGSGDPKLEELRGFAVAGDLLYVISAHKTVSEILVYQGSKKNGYTFKSTLASRDTVSSIFHPFDLTFDGAGHCYVSSQDSNVVTALSASGKPLPVASFLQQEYPAPAAFLAGTFVASATGNLPGVPQPPPPDVAAPQGLELSYTDPPTNSRVANSVRGVVFYNSFLYVADEVGNAVKVYDGHAGELYGQILGENLKAPVHLLLNKGVLYIGSTGNDSVVSYDLSKGAPSGTVAPATFIDGKVNHVAGLAFDADGYFYAAERKAKKIEKFKPNGKRAGDFIINLPDEPEFIFYVPKGK
jgi:hypothetical protein